MHLNTTLPHKSPNYKFMFNPHGLPIMSQMGSIGIGQENVFERQSFFPKNFSQIRTDRKFKTDVKT